MRELYRQRPAGFPLREVGLTGASDAELQQVSKDLGLALSLEEMRTARDYFARGGRDPTDVELQSLGQAWSEHCCYKSSKVFLKEFLFPVQAPYVIDRGDAGVVEFDEQHAYALRIESHNHPSAIEPYGGATTGIGGILRDVLAMGAQPIALADPLHFGPLNYSYSKLPRGVKHPEYLFNGVVSGIRDYGNRVGIPTVAGCIIFDEGYLGNIVVNVGCVGFAKKSQLMRNRVKAVGDVFVLCGGRTGRDGIHGVTYASADLTEEAAEAWSGGAVQIGDAILKEPLIHAVLECARRGLLQGLKDLGGGGLSCVVGEMALAGGLGAEVDLEKVPLKEEGVEPWEIWVSESQERMMLAVDMKNLDEVLAVFALHDVLATPIGRAVLGKNCRVRYRGETVLDLDLAFYTGGPEYRRPFDVSGFPVQKGERAPELPTDLAPLILKLLSSPNIASKEHVIRQYDHEVRASTVLKPLQGKIGKAAHGDAAVIRPTLESEKGLAIAVASTPQLTAIDPFRGGASAVDEACRNLAAVGARPHALTNCLNFGNPEKSDRLGALREAVRGIGSVAQALGLPIPSGNVSLYNESPLGAVPPTPVILATGIVSSLRHCVTTDLKEEGNRIFLIGETKEEMGGSEYYRYKEAYSSVVPSVDAPGLRRAVGGLVTAMEHGAVRACHDVSHGGLAVAVVEMALGGHLGCRVRLDDAAGALRPDVQLFSESNGRWVAEVGAGREEEFLGLLDAVPVREIGRIGGIDVIFEHGERKIPVPLHSARELWTKGMSRLVVGS
ncbi:MAG TPA: phosphoribosylformylglycinamidine synthase subunit PurL [Thermoplasmata archaeon]|nr:phosphoribosylformylglycinamidine synthase subunit PurL [Thermoplasmata archaeon]